MTCAQADTDFDYSVTYIESPDTDSTNLDADSASLDTDSASPDTKLDSPDT